MHGVNENVAAGFGGYAATLVSVLTNHFTSTLEVLVNAFLGTLATFLATKLLNKYFNKKDKNK